MHFVVKLLFVLCLALMVTAQDETEVLTTERPSVFWTTCDFQTGHGRPHGGNRRASCYDCTSIIRCNSFGGLVSNCRSRTPYCVDGRCSAEPSEVCADGAVRNLLEMEELIAYNM